METCYKAFRGEILRNLPLRSNRFDFEPEVTAKVLKRHYKLFEVPISFRGRGFEEGKKITWRDGFTALLYWFDTVCGTDFPHVLVVLVGMGF